MINRMITNDKALKGRNTPAQGNTLWKNALWKWTTVLATMMLLAIQPAHAQDLRGKSNEMIGSISSDGVIRNKNNQQTGRIDSSGAIRNSSNAQIGSIQSDGTVRDRNNAQTGKVQSDGTVRDRSNAQIGKIESDGAVRDRNNAQIGSAKGVKQEWAAAVFFFFPELIHN